MQAGRQLSFRQHRAGARTPRPLPACAARRYSQAGARGPVTGNKYNIHGTFVQLQTGKLSMATRRSPFHDPSTIIAPFPSLPRACASGALTPTRLLCRGLSAGEEADTHEPGIRRVPGGPQRRAAHLCLHALLSPRHLPHWHVAQGASASAPTLHAMPTRRHDSSALAIPQPGGSMRGVIRCPQESRLRISCQHMSLG
jgi:hypothetical protein